MNFEFLDKNNVEQYIDYLRAAFSYEPNGMVAERVEDEQIRARICDPFYAKTKSLLAFDNGVVIGQLEYHFYGCIQDGAKMAYVDWVHVLPSHRKRGVASALFAEFEKDCLTCGIVQYYLIRCENDEAKSFYDKFQNSTTSFSPVLRRTF